MQGMFAMIPLALVGLGIWAQKNLPPPKPKIVGIDLGTTYSVVAAYQPASGTVDIYADEETHHFSLDESPPVPFEDGDQLSVHSLRAKELGGR